jgi:hypothetical protein
VSVRGIFWRTTAAAVCLAVAGLSIFILGNKRGWVEPASPGGQPTVRLISAEQYRATVQDLFGVDIRVDGAFPLMQRRQGLLGLGAAAAAITPGALDEFDRVARSVARQVTDEAHRSTFMPCTPHLTTAADGACAKEFFARVGRLLYRRPLTPSELDLQVNLADATAREHGDFYAGLAYSLAGMLISPKFLYFTEVSEPDPEQPGRLRLNAFAKATRLSLFLWNAPPDEALLEAAATGDIHRRAGLERQVERLLSSPRLERGVRAFFVDLLNFDKFATLAKDQVIYPDFTPAVARSAEEQALRLITDHLLVRKEDYRDLFTTSHTFVDATLGSFYGVSVSSPREWMPYDLDHDDSAGLMTSLSFVAVNAHPGQSSPTRRGRAIREILLCQKIPDPPPNVNFTVFQDPNRQYKTARERLQAHATDPVCAGCHKLTDPMGLALENFDGAGKFRSRENGVLIDTHGTLDGKAFTDVATLGMAMHDHPALGRCLATRLYEYGTAREVLPADRPWLAYITKRFAVHGYRLPDLLREIVTSRAFFAVSGESEGRNNAMAESTITAAATP